MITACKYAHKAQKSDHFSLANKCLTGSNDWKLKLGGLNGRYTYLGLEQLNKDCVGLPIIGSF